MQKADKINFQDGMKYYATFIRSVDEDPIYTAYGARRRRESVRHFQATTRPSLSYNNKKMISLIQKESGKRSMPKVIPEEANHEFDLKKHKSDQKEEEF